MKFYVKLKEEGFNANFEFLETQDTSDYGNGIYASVLRNGKDFQYLDLRYNSNHYLGNEKTFENWLESYFGNNLVSITKQKERNKEMKKGDRKMKQNYFENGTIVGWANDGEEATYDFIEQAAIAADCTGYEMKKALGTDKEFCGTTYFRYGVDAEATKCYDDARDEAEAYEAE